MTTDQEHTCLRKRRFNRRKKAIVAAQRSQREFGRMHAYRCPYSSPAHWHVGHDWRDRSPSRASTGSA